MCPHPNKNYREICTHMLTYIHYTRIFLLSINRAFMGYKKWIEFAFNFGIIYFGSLYAEMDKQ